MKSGQIRKDELPNWIQKMHQRFFGKYGINYDVDKFVEGNSMSNKTNYTKVSETAEEDKVDVVQGDCTEE